jgi:RNA polymerase sigma factor
VARLLLVLFKRFIGKHGHRKGGRSEDVLRPEDAAKSDGLSADSVEEQVLRIQQGDTELQERFLAKYRPFVAKVASRFAKRYIDPAVDDEFSIAYQAFHEAVMNFSESSGTSFFHFAETVMRRRLIDYARKEMKHRAHIPYSAFDTEDDENNVINPVETKHAVERYSEAVAARERRLEIAEISEVLKEFGISFEDLAEASPKHVDSRIMLMEIGRVLGEDEALMSVLLSKKMLPIKELLDKVGVSRKTLERNRKYLIAIALIHSGSYPYLQDYLRPAIPHRDAKEAGIRA